MIAKASTVSHGANAIRYLRVVINVLKSVKSAGAAFLME